MATIPGNTSKYSKTYPATIVVRYFRRYNIPIAQTISVF